MFFQVVSDLHIEKNHKSVRDLIVPKAKFLIVAGDLGHVESLEEYSKAVSEICGMFEKVILIPGNHEYYNSENSQLSMTAINEILKSLQERHLNLTVLINEYVTIENYVIFGSTFWSYCQRHHYFNLPIYTDKADTTQPTGKLLKLSCRDYNALHLEALSELERVIDYCESIGKKLIVVTHYAPSYQGTLHPKYHRSPGRDMYCSNSEHFIANEIIKVWIYGHTGYNGINGKLVTNQMEHGGMRDAILTLID